MEEIVERYDPLKLETIKRLLEREAAAGKPRYYEIYVDNLKVVDRTNDPKQFDSYEEFLYEGVKEIRLQRYTMSELAPRVVSRHIFKMGQEEKKPDAVQLGNIGLGEIEARINDKVSRERERWDYEQLRKELEAEKGKLTEAESYIETLKTIIADTKQKLQDAKSFSDLTGVIKDLAPQFFSVKKEPPALSGKGEQPQGRASFSKQGEGVSLSEDEKRYITLGKEMEERFSDEELSHVVSIIQSLAADTTNIKPVSELLNIKQP